MWGHVPIAPDTSALHHTQHADVISDILIQVCVAAITDRLTVNRWLGMPDSRRGTRRAALSLAERIQAQGEIATHTRGLSNAP